MNNRVLIIEDDKDIAELLRLHISDLGCSCKVARDGGSGLASALENRFDLILLDLMLPDLDGLEICKVIRRERNYTPILMLTARSEELDKVLGLEFGADDYLTKPFSIRELLARVKAILRRVEALKDEMKETVTVIHSRTLKIDLEKRAVTENDRKIDLTAKEFDLLAVFARNPGKPFTRQELLDKVWGYQFDGYDHTVNSHINRLRSKIETNPSEPQYILTVWGIGYKFAEDEE